MRAEVAHLPRFTAQAFALGCLWATIRARAESPGFILPTTRWVLVLGAIGWSAANLWLANYLSGSGATSPATFAYASAAVYGLGALLTALRGLRTTAVLVTPMLILMGLVTPGVGILLPPSPYNSLYQALALEQSVLLAIALLIASGVPRWAAAQQELGR